MTYITIANSRILVRILSQYKDIERNYKKKFDTLDKKPQKSEEEIYAIYQFKVITNAIDSIQATILPKLNEGKIPGLVDYLTLMPAADPLHKLLNLLKTRRFMVMHLLKRQAKSIFEHIITKDNLFSIELLKCYLIDNQQILFKEALKIKGSELNSIITDIIEKISDHPIDELNKPYQQINFDSAASTLISIIDLYVRDPRKDSQLSICHDYSYGFITELATLLFNLPPTLDELTPFLNPKALQLNFKTGVLAKFIRIFNVSGFELTHVETLHNKYEYQLSFDRQAMISIDLNEWYNDFHIGFFSFITPSLLGFINENHTPFTVLQQDYSKLLDSWYQNEIEYLSQLLIDINIDNNTQNDLIALSHQIKVQQQKIINLKKNISNRLQALNITPLEKLVAPYPLLKPFIDEFKLSPLNASLLENPIPSNTLIINNEDCYFLWRQYSHKLHQYEEILEKFQCDFAIQLIDTELSWKKDIVDKLEEEERTHSKSITEIEQSLNQPYPEDGLIPQFQEEMNGYLLILMAIEKQWTNTIIMPDSHKEDILKHIEQCRAYNKNRLADASIKIRYKQQQLIAQERRASHEPALTESALTDALQTLTQESEKQKELLYALVGTRQFTIEKQKVFLSEQQIIQHKIDEIQNKAAALTLCIEASLSKIGVKFNLIEPQDSALLSLTLDKSEAILLKFDSFAEKLALIKDYVKNDAIIVVLTNMIKKVNDSTQAIPFANLILLAKDLPNANKKPIDFIFILDFLKVNDKEKKEWGDFLKLKKINAGVFTTRRQVLLDLLNQTMNIYRLQYIQYKECKTKSDKYSAEKEQIRLHIEQIKVDQNNLSSCESSILNLNKQMGAILTSLEKLSKDLKLIEDTKNAEQKLQERIESKRLYISHLIAFFMAFQAFNGLVTNQKQLLPATTNLTYFVMILLSYEKERKGLAETLLIQSKQCLGLLTKTNPKSNYITEIDIMTAQVQQSLNQAIPTLITEALDARLLSITEKIKVITTNLFVMESLISLDKLSEELADCQKALTQLSLNNTTLAQQSAIDNLEVTINELKEAHEQWSLRQKFADIHKGALALYLTERDRRYYYKDKIRSDDRQLRRQWVEQLKSAIDNFVVNNNKEALVIRLFDAKKNCPGVYFSSLINRMLHELLIDTNIALDCDFSALKAQFNDKTSIDQAIEAFLQSINQLESHALQEQDKYPVLAQHLKTMANDAKAIIHNINRNNVDETMEKIHLCLHQYDDELAHQPRQLSYILKNIFAAVFTLGIALAGQMAYSKYHTGRVRFFGARHQEEEKLIKVEHCCQSIATALIFK